MKKNVAILFLAIFAIIGCFVLAFVQGKEDFKSTTGMSFSVENVKSRIAEKVDPFYEDKINKGATVYVNGLLDLVDSAKRYNELTGSSGVPSSQDILGQQLLPNIDFYQFISAFLVGENSGYVTDVVISNQKAFGLIRKDICVKINELTKKYNGPKCLGINPVFADPERINSFTGARNSLLNIKQGDTVWLYVPFKA